MPVVTTAKRRREFSRRRDVGIAIQEMADLDRVFLADTSQREIRESLRGSLVEFWLGLFRERGDGKQNERGERELLHFAIRHCSATPRNFIDLRSRFLHNGSRCFPKISVGHFSSSPRSWLRFRFCEQSRSPKNGSSARVRLCPCRARFCRNDCRSSKKS